jgi:hypothetical protein
MRVTETPLELRIDISDDQLKLLDNWVPLVYPNEDNPTLKVGKRIQQGYQRVCYYPRYSDESFGAILLTEEACQKLKQEGHISECHHDVSEYGLKFMTHITVSGKV